MARVDDLLAQQLAERPDAPALSDSIGTQWSYEDLEAAVASLAGFLSEAGVQPTDRVMLLSENSGAAIATLFASWRVGAVVVPFNARQTEAEVARIIAHAKPAVVLATTAVSPDAVKHAERLGAERIAGAFGSMHMAKLTPDPDPSLSDVATLLYTTGTTGDPKGVMLTHSGMRFGGYSSAALRKMAPGDVIYGVLPLTHVFGLISVVTAAITTGTKIRVEARFSAAALYQAAMEEVTVMPAVPQMHALVMQYVKEQGLSELGSPSLRYVSSGGAPLDPAWKRKAEAFYGLGLQNGYGLTETHSGASATDNPKGTEDVSCGPPTPGTEIRISDDTGEVLIRGPHIMKGYFRNPTETAKALDADGWLHTGDLGQLDERGHVHILGRSKELIIHGGFNVYPPEVEAAINDHPAVVQSAVVGQMQDGDEKVLAFVQVADMADVGAAELKSFVAERLAGYKRPSRYIIALSLPAAPTGKLLKHKLKEAFADELARPA